jgi:hypothetical protein
MAGLVSSDKEDFITGVYHSAALETDVFSVIAPEIGNFFSRPTLGFCGDGEP